MKKKLKAYESNIKAISKYARNYLLKNIEKKKKLGNTVFTPKSAYAQ